MTIELMKTIVSKIENTTDEAVYVSIFNKLTENNKEKNYMANKNGIFFKLDKFDQEMLECINDLIDTCISTKEQNQTFEEKRSEEMAKMKKTIKPELSFKNCKNDIDNYLTKLDHYSTLLSKDTLINSDDEKFDMPEKTDFPSLRKTITDANS